MVILHCKSIFIKEENMKRILFSIIIILLVGLGIVPNVNDAFATEHTSTSHSNQDQSLSKHKILHTNDIHGRFVEEKVV